MHNWVQFEANCRFFRDKGRISGLMSRDAALMYIFRQPAICFRIPAEF